MKATLLAAMALFTVSLLGCATASGPKVAPVADQTTVVAEHPEWNDGDQWVFRWQVGLSRGQHTVVVESAAPGGYVLRSVERGVQRYFSPTLEYIAAIEDDEIIVQHVPPLPFLKFPLAAGMKWEQGEGAIPAGST